MPRRLAAGLALASGVLLALCLPRPGLCFLGWIGLAPLLYAVTRRPRREAFWLGLLAGFAFHGVAFYWIYSTCRFARVPAPAAILAWSALAGFEALAWGLSVWFGRWACEDLPAPWRALGWAVVWTAGAVIWERWTPRLPGDLLEYTQWRFLSLIQIASLAGPHALGFIVAFVNAALAEAWDRSQAIRADAGEASGLALALGLALASWGYGLVSLAARRSGGPSARVELLQPNIDQYQKWSPAYSGDILKVFDALLSLPRTKPPALIVWPESALPRLAAEGEAPAEAAAWSRRLGAFQIVGAVTEDGRGRRYNSALLLGPRGRLRATYHKRELVPFGEYVPFHWLGRFIGILDQLGGIQAGSARQPLFETPLGLAAASICYEAAFPRWARLDASRGARVIVNITNDGWYKRTWGPYQDFYENVFRAVENRVVVIRSGNTGVSAAIDPWGVVLAEEPLGRRARLDADVPARDAFPAGSFYARHGDWLGWLSLALAAALAAAAARR